MASTVQKLFSRLPQLAKELRAAAVPRYHTFVSYAKVEMKPSFSEWPEIKKGCVKLIDSARTQKWKQLSVKEAFINTVVAAEVVCWFFIGECIGKGSIIGYQIEGATNFEPSF